MFKKYATIYDYFNLDKNYNKEVNYLLKIIKRFKKKKYIKFLILAVVQATTQIYLQKRNFLLWA